MEENKKEIIEKLTKAVMRTREGQCIQNIVYKKGYGDDEIVYINYGSITKLVGFRVPDITSPAHV